MAFDISQTRMVIAYNNKVNPTDCVSAVANFTPDSGFPIGNVLYDDPWLKVKHSSTFSSAGIGRYITFDFGVSVTFNCLGIVAHDLKSRGYTAIYPAYETSPGSGTYSNSPWSGQAITSMVGNPNFLLRFASTSAQRWRLYLVATDPIPAFEIGMIFFGTSYEVAQNPTDGGIFITQEAPLTFQDASGGARFVVPGARKLLEHAELSFARITLAMQQTLEQTIHLPNAGRIVAVIPPEQVGSALPVGTQHLFGYIKSLTPSPRHGLSHKYDLTMSMEGCV